MNTYVASISKLVSVFEIESKVNRVFLYLKKKKKKKTFLTKIKINLEFSEILFYIISIYHKHTAFRLNIFTNASSSVSCSLPLQIKVTAFLLKVRENSELSYL